MLYNAMDIARYIINYSLDLGKPVSNLKLQKLLYYIQAAFLIEKDKPCFREPIYNWRHGAVVEEVYNNFTSYIGSNITDYQYTYNDIEIDYKLNVKRVIRCFDENKIKKEDRKIIRKIVYRLKDVEEWDLVAKIQQEEPYMKTSRYHEITLKIIKNYFNETKLNT